MDLQYKIVYKQGTDNGAVDALSRRPHTCDQLLIVSVITPQWVQDVKDSYAQDSVVWINC
jgi:hypothetical protein